MVIQIEDESDVPGVLTAWGPYETYEKASQVANDAARVRGLPRGYIFQVARLEEHD